MRLIVVGDDLVAAEFTHAATTVNERLVEEGRKVAEAVADTQRQLVRKRSGATAQSVSAERSERDNVIWEIGPETFYSRFLEMGTVHMPPYPFVGPSGDLHADDWYETAADIAADV